MNKPVLLITIFLISIPVKAYIGPGMGGGALVAIFAFFAAIFFEYMGSFVLSNQACIKEQSRKKDLTKRMR